jgi:hypothetical protein
MNGEGIGAGSAREDVAEQGADRSPMGAERVRGEDTLTVIEHSGPRCRACGVVYIAEYEGPCQEPRCYGSVDDRRPVLLGHPRA